MWRDPYVYLAEFTGSKVVAANGEQTISVNIDRESDFEIYRTNHLATSVNYRSSLLDQDDRLLVGGIAPAVNIFGDGQRPFRWPSARRIKRTNQIRSRVIDMSGAPNTVRQLFIGAQVYPFPPFVIPHFKWAEPYTLELNFGAEANDDAVAIPANGSITFSRRPPGGSWFEIHSLLIARTGAATIQILTNGAREWFRNPVHVDLLGASDFVTTLNSPSQWPFDFTPPKLLPVNSLVTVVLADLSAALNPVRVTFWGVRKYLDRDA